MQCSENSAINSGCLLLENSYGIILEKSLLK